MQFSLLDQLRVAKMEKLLVRCHLDASVWDFTTVTSITLEVHFTKAAYIKSHRSKFGCICWESTFLFT